MRLAAILLCVMTLFLLGVPTKAKPTVGVKVVKLPFFLPKVEVDVLGIVGAKAALLGHTLRTKANILHKVADLKKGLGTLLTSLAPKGPLVSIVTKPVAVAPSSVYGTPTIPATISTHSVPSSSYGLPPASAPYPSTAPASAPYPSTVSASASYP